VHARIAVLEPTGTALGTVVLHEGGGGTEPFDHGFVPELVARGFRTVPVFWESDWQQTEVGSVKAAACRPATALEWIFEEHHLSDRTTGYCALGHSSGSAAVAYSLAHYGAGEILDHALLSSGPVFSRIDAACDPVMSGLGGRSLRASGCEEFPVAPFVYGEPDAELVAGWVGDASCGPPYGDLEDPQALREQSILSAGASLAYPMTRLDTWWCEDDTSGAAGQGTFYADEVQTELVRHCATGCDGEASWANPDELAAMVDTIAAECVPRHPYY
jgi:hypothetical protein